MAFFLKLDDDYRSSPILGIPKSTQFTLPVDDDNCKDASSPLPFRPPTVKRTTRADTIKYHNISLSTLRNFRLSTHNTHLEKTLTEKSLRLRRRFEDAGRRRERAREKERMKLREHHKKVDILRSPSKSPFASPSRTSLSSSSGYSSMFTSPSKSPSTLTLSPPLFNLSSSSPSLPLPSKRRVSERLHRAAKRRLSQDNERVRKGAEARARIGGANERRERAIGERKERARADVWKAEGRCREVRAAKNVQRWYGGIRVGGDVRVKAKEIVECFGGDKFNVVAGGMRDKGVIKAAREMLEGLGGRGEDCRCFLSALLCTRFPEETMDDKEAGRIVRWAGGRVLKELEGGDVARLRAAVGALIEVFKVWKDKDKNKLVTEMKVSGLQTWTIYLTSDAVLKRIGEVDPTKAARLGGVKVNNEHGRNGARRHLIRLRKALNEILGDKEEARLVLSGLKEEALGGLNLDSIRKGVDELVRETDANANTPDIDATDNVKASGINDDGVVKLSTKDQPKVGAKDAKNVMTNPELVHRILVQPVDKVHELTMDGTPVATTPVYGDDGVAGGEGIESRIQETMRRAFWDDVKGDVEGGEFERFDDATGELMNAVVDLVPNRSDLVEAFRRDLEEPNDVESRKRNLVKIGTFLKSLESPYRANTTQEWIGRVPDIELVESLKFLLLKAECCHVDVVNGKLMQIAPFVKNNGAEYERSKFAEAYVEEGDGAEGLKEWAERLKGRMEEGLELEVICKGGVMDDIVFARDANVKLPEVFNMDVPVLMEVREVAKVSGVACAIVAHLRSALKAGQEGGEGKMRALVEVLGGGRVLEEDVFGTCWQMGESIAGRKMEEGEKEILKGKIRAVLGGEDAVAKLYGRRVEGWFKALLLKKRDAVVVPEGMRSGLMKGVGGGREGRDDWIEKAGREEAGKLGLGVVVDELVGVGGRVKRVVDHMWMVHGELVTDLIGK